MASRGYMGPSEAQALVLGRWVSIVGDDVGDGAGDGTAAIPGPGENTRGHYGHHKHKRHHGQPLQPHPSQSQLPPELQQPWQQWQPAQWQQWWQLLQQQPQWQQQWRHPQQHAPLPASAYRQSFGPRPFHDRHYGHGPVRHQAQAEVEVEGCVGATPVRSAPVRPTSVAPAHPIYSAPGRARVPARAVPPATPVISVHPARPSRTTSIDPAVPPASYQRHRDYGFVEGWGWWPSWFPYWDSSWNAYWQSLYDYYGGDANPDYAEYERDAMMRQIAAQQGWM